MRARHPASLCDRGPARDARVRRRGPPPRPGRCRRASSPTRSPTTARPGCWSPPATSRCSTRAACCGRRGSPTTKAPTEIRAEGPLLLTDPAGGVLLADAAALTPDLEDGLISSARLLIAGQLQLAAAEVRRKDGRYATLYRTVASSCTICAENPTPTWAIRASRVTRGRRGPAHLLRERPARAVRPAGRLPAAAEHPRARRRRGRAACWRRSSCSRTSTASASSCPTTACSAPRPTRRSRRSSPPAAASSSRASTAAASTTAASTSAASSRSTTALDGNSSAAAAASPPPAPSASAGGFVADFDLAVASDDSFLAQFDYSDADRLTSTAAHPPHPADEYVSSSAPSPSRACARTRTPTPPLRLSRAHLPPR